MITTGGSLLTRSDWEESTVDDGDFHATHKIGKKDETAVPRYGAQKAVGGAAVDAVVPAINSFAN